jgi:hypothetical protein
MAAKRSVGRSEIVLMTGDITRVPIDATANVAPRKVIAHLEGDTGIERVTFVLRGDALDAFRRRLATL